MTDHWHTWTRHYVGDDGTELYRCECGGAYLFLEDQAVIAILSPTDDGWHMETMQPGPGFMDAVRYFRDELASLPPREP
jgi:hypothetical protein